MGMAIQLTHMGIVQPAKTTGQPMATHKMCSTATTKKIVPATSEKVFSLIAFSPYFLGSSIIFALEE
jgi:hypothetical protein